MYSGFIRAYLQKRVAADTGNGVTVKLRLNYTVKVLDSSKL